MRTTFGRFAALAAIAALLSVSLAIAAEADRATPQKPAAAKEADKPAGGSPQNRMKTCNAEAAKKVLKGDERRAFMSACLKS